MEIRFTVVLSTLGPRFKGYLTDQTNKLNEKNVFKLVNI